MPFTIESRPLGDAVVLVPSVFEDQRGFFLETFRSDQHDHLKRRHRCE